MGFEHTLTTNVVLKKGTTLEQVIEALQPLLTYFNYVGHKAFAGETTKGNQFSFDHETGEVYLYTNGSVCYGFYDLVENAAKLLGPMVVAPGYFELANHDTADLENARSYIYYGASEQEIEEFKAHSDIEEAMSLLSGIVDDRFKARLREIVMHAIQPKKVNSCVVDSDEKIRSILMQDMVGDYDTPDTVPEWAWIERAASYSHIQNGENGIWEFVLNLSKDWNDIPVRLLPTICEARADNISYLIVHQGT